MSQIRLDSTTLHNDDIGPVIGDFHSTAIVQVDFEAAKLRESRTQDRIAAKVRALEER